VGPHKTGTSALQRFFFDNTAFLAAQGVAYPVTGRWTAAHHDLAIASRLSYGTLLNELRDEIRSEETVLVSSEIFSLLNRRALVFLQTHIPPAKIDVCYMLRQLPQLWYSYWREGVKHGLTLGFDHYVEAAPHLDPHTFRTRPLPSQQLSHLCHVFGSASLRVGSYDARVEAGGYAIGFLRDFVGIDAAKPRIGEEHVNVGLHQPRVECLRHLNKRATSCGLDRESCRRIGRMFVDGAADVGEDLMSAFKELCAKSPVYVCANDGAAARNERELVLGRHGALLLDGAKQFSAPGEVRVAMIDDDALSPWVEAALDKLFEGLVGALKSYKLPGVHRFL